MQQANPQSQNSYVKVKGLSWLLEKQNNPHHPTSTPDDKILKIEKQAKKWKKHVANRFEGYNKTVEKFIQSQFKRQTERQNNYEYDSLRKTQTNFNYAHRIAEAHQDKRKEYESTIFTLKRKERDIYNEISKMKLLKEMSEICEKKKNFYDGCVDQYFQNYRKDINRTITKLADRSTRDSKAKINRS